MSTHIIAIKALALGVSTLSLVIGISRFGYGLLIDKLIFLSNTQIGVIGTSNLSGYFIGCLFMIVLNNTQYSLNWLRLMLFINLLCMVGLYFSNDASYWIVFRFFGGLSGGICFVFISIYCIEILNQTKRNQFSYAIYSGVGIGIILSSTALYFNAIDFKGNLNYQIVLAIIFFCISLISSLGLNDIEKPKTYVKKKKYSKSTFYFTSYLIASYSLEGMGYILYATYIFPFQIASSVDIRYVFLNWFFLGLGAVIGPIALTILTKELKTNTIILRLFIGQVISILLTLIDSNILFNTLSTFIFGLTFMSLTSGFILYVKEIWPNKNTMIAIITTGYSLGQSLGPVIGGYYNSTNEGYRSSIVLSIFTIFASIGFFYLSELIKDKKLEHKNRGHI